MKPADAPPAEPAHDHAGPAHGHGCHHQHADASNVPARRLLQALACSIVITGTQVVGGLLAHSLALLSDALHTLTDAVSLLVSYAALRLARRPASERFTFGFKRAETLAAVLNSGLLIGISFWLLAEAAGRLLHPPAAVNGRLMIGVASVSLVANVINSLLLRRGAKDNLNLRAAYLHVLSDGVVSLAVIGAGVAIMRRASLQWLDPVLTLLIALWLVYESWAIIWSGTRVLMMSAPDDVPVRAIEAALTTLPGVRNVHHVHLWVLNDQAIHLDAHVDVADRPVSETDALARQIEELLRAQWGVTHVTLQFESGRCGEKPSLLAGHAG